MPTIAEIRQKYPQYNDMSDADLAGALHKKYYSDLPVDVFNQKIGLAPSGSLPAITVTEGGDEPKPPPPPVDDHGLARRQAMSPWEKAISPITEYKRNYLEMNAEAQHQFGSGLSQLAEGFGQGLSAEPGDLKGLATFGKGAANTAMGALGYLGSPLNAAYRSIVGQPIEDVTGIPREQTEFTAQLLTPGLGFTKLAKAPGVAEEFPLIKPATEPKPPAMEQAAEVLRQEGLPADVPRAITGGGVAQRTGQYVSNVPYVGAPVSTAIHEKLPAQMESARNVVAADLGAGTGPNVANRVGVTLREAADAETRAATEAATEADRVARANWEAANQAREQAISDREAAATRGTAPQLGDVPPVQTGDAIIDTIRDNHEAARIRKNDAYREAGAIDASVLDEANSGLANSVRADLRKDVAGQGRVDITADAAKTSRKMVSKIVKFAQDAKKRLVEAQQEAIDGGGTAADAAQTGKSMQALEQLRQDLNFHASGAENDADRRAADRIIEAFDNWREKAMQNSLMEGSDPGALAAFQRAREANRDWRQRFGYNERNDADLTLNKIVQPGNQIGSGDVAKALTDAAPDKGKRLLDAIYEATADHPDRRAVQEAIRGGFVNKLTAPIEGLPRTPKDIRKAVYTFTGEQGGRRLADGIFRRDEQMLLRKHADALVQAEQARGDAAKFAKASEPKPTKVEPGEAQQLADRVMGKGKPVDEALFDTLHGYAKTGGDVKTLAQVVARLPQGMRGDLAGSFVRNLGVAPGTKQFSLDHFATQWKNISPQAKAVMFGTTGHVASLDAIATVAQGLKTIKGRFGNPSGTAQNTLFGAMMGLAGMSPATAAKAVAAGGVGHIAARMLASPAGSSSLAKYAQAVQRAEQNASMSNLMAVKMTQRNMANTARGLFAGADIRPK